MGFDVLLAKRRLCNGYITCIIERKDTLCKRSSLIRNWRCVHDKKTISSRLFMYRQVT